MPLQRVKRPLPGTDHTISHMMVRECVPRHDARSVELGAWILSSVLVMVLVAVGFKKF
jgi:hypothetical protein